MSKPILELKNVQTLVNKGTANETMILKGINLQINAGDFITIVGTNGAGKSTSSTSSAGTCTPTTVRSSTTVVTSPGPARKTGPPSSHGSFRIPSWGRLPG